MARFVCVWLGKASKSFVLATIKYLLLSILHILKVIHGTLSSFFFFFFTKHNCSDVHNYMRHVPVVEKKEVASKVEEAWWSGVEEETRARAADEQSPPPSPPPPPPQLIISGGGGAFLHPTHCLGNETLERVAGTGGIDYERIKCFPDATTSSSLSIQNLFQFRKRNWRFDAVGGLAYLIMTYPLFSGCPLATNVTNNMTMTEIVRGFNYDV